MYNKCIYICVLMYICLWHKWAVLGAKDQTVRQQSSLHRYLVDSSWVRGRERWASWEMRQCTIMCSPYLHGNRNGRAEAHIRSRSHAQTEYDETQSQPTVCLITHHTETHTVTTCLSVSLYQMDIIREVVRDTMTPIQHRANTVKGRSWKCQLHAQHHLSSNTLNATVTLHRNK